MNTPITNFDLSKQAPASPRTRLAGFVIARRAVDKCRASLAGTAGEYHYDCPLDNLLFSFKGITGDQFKTAVQAAATYEDVGAWLLANGTAKTPPEIEDWSDDQEGDSMMKNPEKRAYFMEHCAKLKLNPEKTTTFDWLEADDRAGFPVKPAKAVAPAAKPRQPARTGGKPAQVSAFAATVQTPVFPKTLHQFRPPTNAATSKPAFSRMDLA